LFSTDPDTGFFPNPDPDYGSGSRIQIQVTENKFFQSKNKSLGDIFVFNPQSRYFIFVFKQSSRYFIKQNYCLVSFLKISENHEKFVEKVDFYSSISLSGSGFRIRIRIQPGNLNPDPPGSGSETLPKVP